MRTGIFLKKSVIKSKISNKKVKFFVTLRGFR